MGIDGIGESDIPEVTFSAMDMDAVKGSMGVPKGDAPPTAPTATQGLGRDILSVYVQRMANPELIKPDLLKLQKARESGQENLEAEAKRVVEEMPRGRYGEDMLANEADSMRRDDLFAGQEWNLIEDEESLTGPGYMALASLTGKQLLSFLAGVEKGVRFLLAGLNAEEVRLESHMLTKGSQG